MGLFVAGLERVGPMQGWGGGFQVGRGSLPVKAVLQPGRGGARPEGRGLGCALQLQSGACL